MKKRILSITLLLVSIIIISGCTINGFYFEYVGDKDPVTVPQDSHKNIILDFSVGVGSITLKDNPSADYLAYITNEVSIRERSGKKLEDAKEASYSEVDSSTMKIQFDSEDEGIQVDYQYDLTITVSINISLQIDFHTTTGTIDIELTGESITINTLHMESSTGNISLTLDNVAFSDSTPIVGSSTGNQELSLSNLNYSKSTTWVIYVPIGNIDLTIVAGVPSTDTMTHSFGIDGASGSITVLASLHDDYGLRIVASVSTGTITIPGGGTSYTSTNFNTANQKYDFDLTTSTGDITYSSS